MEEKNYDKLIKNITHSNSNLNEFMQRKIEEKKANKNNPQKANPPEFLLKKKADFLQSLDNQDQDKVMIEEIVEKKGIPVCDVNYFAVQIRYYKNEYNQVGDQSAVKTYQQQPAQELPEEINEKIIQSEGMKHKIFKSPNFSKENKKMKMKKPSNQAKESQAQITKEIQDNVPDFLKFSANCKEEQKKTEDSEENRKENKKNIDFEKKQNEIAITTVDQKKYTIEENMCVFCQENQIDVILWPCGHVSCCKQCLVEKDECKCPICHNKIKSQIEKAVPQKDLPEEQKTNEEMVINEPAKQIQTIKTKEGYKRHVMNPGKKKPSGFLQNNSNEQNKMEESSEKKESINNEENLFSEQKKEQAYEPQIPNVKEEKNMPKVPSLKLQSLKTSPIEEKLSKSFQKGTTNWYPKEKIGLPHKESMPEKQLLESQNSKQLEDSKDQTSSIKNSVKTENLTQNINEPKKNTVGYTQIAREKIRPSKIHVSNLIKLNPAFNESQE